MKSIWHNSHARNLLKRLIALLHQNRAQITLNQAGRGYTGFVI